MPRVLMYTTDRCPYCLRAEALLRRKGVAEIEKINIEREPARRQEMETKVPGARTVPQIFIGAVHVGGCDDLHELDRRGELDTLLAA